MPFSIPSPSESIWYLGPLPLRAYALSIIIGAVLAVYIGERRFQAMGGRKGAITDIAFWAIPAGIIGARIYHVLTDWQLYFGEGRSAVRALYIWEGGLGIWGAISVGAFGAYLAARHYELSMGQIADALAPGLLVAQAVGRLGNWFNQELFGRPTSLPWGLEIAPQYRPDGFTEFETFHPTFLYEAMWNLAAAAILVWVIAPRIRQGYGRLFAAYVMLYTAGRFWIEGLRIDSANEIGIFRINEIVSVLVFIGAAVYWYRTRNKGADGGRSGKETATS